MTLVHGVLAGADSNLKDQALAHFPSGRYDANSA